MPEETKDCAGACSRRQLLQSAVGMIGIAAAVAARSEPAFATIKISMTAVAYQDHPEGDKRCGKCRQFVSPDSCKIVDGEISPQGCCSLFAPIS